MLDKRMLPVAEWFAENAYIAPGKHRLMTALGLMVGLYTGREMMNTLTGMNQQGEAIDKSDLAPPLQRFHGILGYNRYDDTTDVKWHKVADAFVPLFFGAVGAMTGSAYFAKTTPIMKSLARDLSKGSRHFHLQHADMLANKKQAELTNYLSGIGLNMGSTTGVHLFPTMLASSTSAFRFQLDHGKNIIFPGLRKISGNRGHSSRNMFTTMGDFISWAQNNAAHYTKQGWYKAETQPLLHYAKDMLQVFKEATPSQRKLVEQRLEQLCESLDSVAARESARTGTRGEALIKELSRESSEFNKKLKHFIGDGLEKTFIDAGLIDPMDMGKTVENIALGDYGIISRAISILGGRKQLDLFGEQFERSMRQRIRGDNTARRTLKLLPKDGAPFLTGGLATAGTLGLVSQLGSRKETVEATLREEQETKESNDMKLAAESMPRHTQARLFHNTRTQQRGNSTLDFINGKPLDVMSWMSSVLVVPPGLHRFMNAAFLSGFLFAGAKVSSTLAARDLRGAYMPVDKVLPFLRPLHGKMQYVWRSSKIADRWKHVAHQLLPVGVGIGGTYTGSRLYFNQAIDRANNAEYLEEYTDRVSLEESESYARASAVTSILNTGSGFHLLPFISYPSNLQNRFLMAKGQQVATPGLGKWWSGNPSKYPWHVRRLLDAMINYATHNSCEFPQEFDEMAYALVAKLYPDLPLREQQDKRDILVDKLYSIRDKYWQEGGIPEEKKESCKQELEANFRREGLEKTLLEVGLDPLKANLDHNGMSGRVAKWFGADHTVNNTINEYRHKAAARLNKETPEPTIQAPAQEKDLIALAEHAQSREIH